MDGSSASPPSMTSALGGLGGLHLGGVSAQAVAAYLPSPFSNALGGLSALTSGLSVGTGGGASSGGGGAAHPPLTPSPSSDSPQQVDASRAPNSSQQSWTFEEQFKQVSFIVG